MAKQLFMAGAATIGVILVFKNYVIGGEPAVSEEELNPGDLLEGEGLSTASDKSSWETTSTSWTVSGETASCTRRSAQIAQSNPKFNKTQNKSYMLQIKGGPRRDIQFGIACHGQLLFAVLLDGTVLKNGSKFEIGHVPWSNVRKTSWLIRIDIVHGVATFRCNNSLWTTAVIVPAGECCIGVSGGVGTIFKIFDIVALRNYTLPGLRPHHYDSKSHVLQQCSHLQEAIFDLTEENRLNFVVIGQSQSGKSSLINTLLTSCLEFDPRGRIHAPALPAELSGHGTQIFAEYEMPFLSTDHSARKLNVSLLDTIGMMPGDDEYKNPNYEGLYQHLLEGRIQDGFTEDLLRLRRDKKKELERKLSERELTIDEMCHGIILVAKPRTDNEGMKDLYEVLQKTRGGMRRPAPMLGVVTHLDMTWKEHHRGEIFEMDSIFHDEHTISAFEDVADMMRLHSYPARCYDRTLHSPDPFVNLLALEILHNLVRDAVDYKRMKQQHAAKMKAKQDKHKQYSAM